MMAESQAIVVVELRPAVVDIEARIRQHQRLYAATACTVAAW